MRSSDFLGMGLAWCWDGIHQPRNPMRKISMTTPNATFALVAILSAASCVQSSDDGEEEEQDALSVDGKSDTFASPTEHGELGLRSGDGQFASITSAKRFHAWTFSLSAAAELNLDTRIGTAFGPQVDTVMYLYKVGTPGFIAKNDNVTSGAKWSQIRKQLSAGSYRIIVKGKLRETRGKISVSADCSGRGCFAAEWLPALKTQYEDQGSEGLHNVAFASLPMVVRNAANATLRDMGEDTGLDTFDFDAGDGKKAFLIEYNSEALLVVELYGPDGRLAASGSATESGALEWN
jgi:hypothetical protein